jgi:hypothetical protein
LFATATEEEQEQQEERRQGLGQPPAATFSEEEWDVLRKLHSRATGASEAAREVLGFVSAEPDKQGDWSSFAFQNVVEETLPKLSPSIIMKLKSATVADDEDDEKCTIVQDLSNALQSVLNKELESAYELLQSLMTAGEIKKLDALIGQASRNQQLNVAFFQVLQMNMQDALTEEQQRRQHQEGGEDGTASRYQILQHIYTRCQEEVEKTVDPGMALLSKLLRTQVDSIRRNQLEHYLGRPKSTITSPDGKQIELNTSGGKPLVDHSDLSQAIANTVRQIRTVETAGGTDRQTAAGMVESCRAVAKEARVVLGEQYGIDSPQLIAFEDALMPVFRPTSTDSPYIQGNDTAATVTEAIDDGQPRMDEDDKK